MSGALPRYFKSDKINEDEMVRACGTYGREKIQTKSFIYQLKHSRVALN
jgi:hypothetical protein